MDCCLERAAWPHGAIDTWQSLWEDVPLFHQDSLLDCHGEAESSYVIAEMIDFLKTNKSV